MKVTRLAILALTFALAAQTAGDVLAQGGGRGGRGGRGGGPPGGFGGGRGGGSIVELLAKEEVREELEMDEMQVEALGTVRESLQEDMRSMAQDIGGGNFREMSEEDRRKVFEKMQKKREELEEKVTQALDEVLLPEQSERLHQIRIQVQGIRALADEKVAEQLEITAEQKKEMEEVQDKMRSEMAEKFREARESGDFGAMRDLMPKMQEKTEAAMMEILTAEQKKKFEEMKGEPFEMPENDRGGFGGGRGGAGGGFGGRRGGDDSDRGGRGGRGGGRGE